MPHVDRVCSFPVLSAITLLLALSACKPPCSTASDCGDGERCSAGVCLAVCTSSQDCPSDQECSERVCTPRPAVDPNAGPTIPISPTTVIVFEEVFDQLNETVNYEPAEGVTVVFHDADGTTLATSTTRADGRVSYAIPEHGMLTVLPPVDSLYGPTTIMDFPQGADITFGKFRSFRTSGAGYRTAVANLEEPPMDSNYQRVFTGCNFFSDDVFFSEHCSNDQSQGTALAIAYRDESGQSPLAFSVLDPIDLTVSSLLLNFPEWRTDWDYALVNVRGLRADWTLSGQILGFRNKGLFIYELGEMAGPVGADGSATLSFRQAPNIATEYVRETAINRDDGASRDYVYIYDSVTAAEMSVPLEASALLGFTDQFAAKVAEGTLSWTPPPDAADAGFIQLRYRNTRPWTIMFAPDRTSLSLPKFPATLTGSSPPKLSGAIAVEVTITDDDSVEGWDDYLLHDAWTGYREGYTPMITRGSSSVISF